MNTRPETHVDLREFQFKIGRNPGKMLPKFGRVMIIRPQQIRHRWIIRVMLQNS